jgi:hypothetical protein
MRCRVKASDRDYICEAFKDKDGRTLADRKVPWTRAHKKVRMSKKQRRKMRQQIKERNNAIS